jgi:hypothetical protein
MEAVIVHKKGKAAGRPAYAEIERDECVECAVCYLAGVCPTDAIVKEDLSMPRLMRAFFSDSWHSHPGTDIPGRGTEEMKTNEVTRRFREGQIGFGLEFGRPGIGCHLKETEPAIARFTALGALEISMSLLATLNASTGLSWTQEDLLKAGERITTLQKLLNIRYGWKKEQDFAWPKRFMEPVSSGPAAGKIPEGLDQAILDYYEYRQWDGDGKPTAALLERLEMQAYA